MKIYPVEYLRQVRFKEAQCAFYEAMLSLEIFLDFMHRLMF
jgi:hypothetical protein